MRINRYFSMLSVIAITLLITVFSVSATVARTAYVPEKTASFETLAKAPVPAGQFQIGHSIRFLFVAEAANVTNADVRYWQTENFQTTNRTITANLPMSAACSSRTAIPIQPIRSAGYILINNRNSARLIFTNANLIFAGQTNQSNKPPNYKFDGFGADRNARASL